MGKHLITDERDALIFDCDGVFYSWGIFGGMAGAMAFCAEVKAIAVRCFLPDLTVKEIKEIGTRSYLETGDGLRYFVDLAEAQGWDREEFQHQIHVLYHQTQFRLVSERYPEVLTQCQETIELLRALKEKGVKIGVLSQSCLINWLTPLLTAKGYINHINRDFIFGFKEFGWNEKSASARGLGMIMEKMNVDQRHAIFFEDTGKNFIPVRQTYPKVLNAHLHDTFPRNDNSDYIDVTEQYLLPMLRKVAMAHGIKFIPSIIQHPRPPLEFRPI